MFTTNTFQMIFKFDPKIRAFIKNLENINSALKNLRVSQIHLQDFEGYVVSQTIFGKNNEESSTKYFYGLDAVALECKQEEGEDIHVYQIETAAFPKNSDILLKDENVFELNEPFHAKWTKEHPERVIREMLKLSYEKAEVYLLLHHERKKENTTEENTNPKPVDK